MNARKMIIIGGLVISATVAVEAAERGLARNGRWFTYNGQPAYLVGVDMQSLAARTDLDSGKEPFYERVLNHLQTAGVNKVRIWANCYFLAPAICRQPFAFENGKFNLDKWDSVYWERMRDFAQKAKDRGIIVEFTLFSLYHDGWHRPATAWNKQRNSNRAFTKGIPEFFHTGVNGLPYHNEKTASGHDYRYFQQRLVDKAVAELGSFGNVYFETFNEFPGDVGSMKLWKRVYPWNQAMADYLHAKGHIVSVHVSNVQDWEPSRAEPRGLKYYWDRPSVDILGLHTYQDDPNAVSAIWHEAQRKGKLLQCNESFDFRTELDKCTREAWGTFLAGGYHAFYCEDKDFTKVGDEVWQQAMRRLKVIRDVAESVRFWEMAAVDPSGTEHDSLIKAGPTGTRRQLFCKPGRDYIAYFWGHQSSDHASIYLPEGTYTYKWIDVRDGSVLASGRLAGGGNVRIAAPQRSVWSGDAGVALLIRATRNERP